jgi:hypothetical protein
MLQKHRTPIAALLLLLTTAQAPPPTSSPATTEPSWGELQRLRAENAALKEKLRAAETQLAASTATQPATQPREIIRKFTTMADILAKVPVNLQPAAAPAWRKYTEGKFLDWWRDQLVGMKLEQTLQLNSVGTTRGGPPQLPWRLSCTFSGRSFNSFGKPQSWHISSQYLLNIDEDTARKWDKVKPGRLFKVTGTITNAGFYTPYATSGIPSYTIGLTLTDMQISDP